MMTDPIADMLTRIRNASAAFHPTVDVPHTRLKEAIAALLAEEKYIKGYEVVETDGRKTIRVSLLYLPGRKRAIREIARVSTPGRRVYVSRDEIPLVKDGLGLAVISTSRGLVSGRVAQELGLGGEVLFTVW